MMTVDRRTAEKPHGASVPQEGRGQESERCATLFVTNDNILGDEVEATAYRQLAGALAAHGSRCEVICRFVVPGDGETEVGAWLDARKWAPDPAGVREDADRCASPHTASR
jgi:hypothetical protein